MGGQPVHEGELIVVFLARRRIAVGQIDAREPQHARARGDHRLDVARLYVGLVARQAAGDLERALGEDGDAVECLLPVGGDIVAERLDLGARERFVLAFELLQAKRVGARTP